MKLMKATLRRLWRLTRATSVVVGLAVMVGLLAGVASLAVARTPSGGDTASAVLKGVTNTANAVTTLINTGTGPALSLQSQSGNPPLAVNSDIKVDNLNADKVDGKDSADFLAASGTAANADKLDGKDSTEFLGATAKAADSDKLDGKDSTEFLAANGKAADSDKLDGKDSTEFAAASTGRAFFSHNTVTANGVVTRKVLPAGSYVITGSVAETSFSTGPDRDTFVGCRIKIDNDPIISGAQAPGFYRDVALSMTTAFTAGGTVEATLTCEDPFSDSVAFNGDLTAIRVSSIQ